VPASECPGRRGLRPRDRHDHTDQHRLDYHDHRPASNHRDDPNLAPDELSAGLPLAACRPPHPEWSHGARRLLLLSALRPQHVTVSPARQTGITAHLAGSSLRRVGCSHERNDRADDGMGKRELAFMNARGRIAFGAALVALPQTARVWIGGDAIDHRVTILARALGARDAALGLGVAIALDRGAPVRGWLEACALADLADLAATALASRSIPPPLARGAMALAGGSALLCAVLSRTLDNPPEAGRTQAPEAALTGHPPATAMTSA
jgi:hypothetical protein